MDVSPHDPSLAEIAHAHGQDQSGHLRIYRRVFLALTFLTAVEYFYAHLFKNVFAILLLGLLVVGLVKAAMVGLYFMHLKYEGRWIVAILLPPCLLAMVLVLALVPDVAAQPGLDASPPAGSGLATPPGPPHQAAPSDRG